jgi:outer membrane protein assembly factor BamE
MPAMPPRQTRLVLAAAAALALLAGCGSMDNATRRFTDAITPYQVEVVQGNFISREQVEAVRPGMSREQVRQVLGTPLVTSLFHGDRWDYVFTLRRKGLDPQQRRLTAFFKGEALDHVEGDTMPSEAEFVSTLDKHQKTGKVPPLEATEEQLRAFSSGNQGQPAAPVPAATTPPAPGNYPPLEAPSR